MRALFTTTLFCLVIIGCSLNDPCRGVNEAPGAPRGATNINGRIYGVSDKDTIPLSSSEVRIVYINGFDTDCGFHYKEDETIITDSSGLFKMSDNAYDHCGYYYEINRYGYFSLSIGRDENYEVTGVLCPESLNGVKIYLQKK